MSRHKLFAFLAITVMVFALSSGLETKPAQASIFLGESQVTSNSADQENPDAYFKGLYGIIVWQDNRNSNWDIYMYAPSVNMWNPEIQVTTNTLNQLNPRVYNDTIVWQDDRNGNWDIYTYNISSKVETQLTSSITDQVNPDIDGNRIVWQDYSTGQWSIYMYDLTTKTERRVVDGPATSPAISGNRIAYQQSYGWYTGIWIGGVLTWDTVKHIECLDIATGQVFHVSNPTGSYEIWPQYSGGLVYNGASDNYFNPAISSDYVAYQGQWGGVYLKDLATSNGGLISGGSSQSAAVYQNQPGVYYAVYTDNRNGDWDIYLFNTLYAGTSSPLEYRVTNNAANQINPVVMEGRILFQDNRNGNWDIFETDVGYGAGGGGEITPKPITPTLVMKNLQEIKSIIADTSQVQTSDFAGANNQVRENRRNAIINQLDSAITSIQAAANTQNLNVRRTDCQSAIDQLNDLMNKMDGWSLRGSADLVGSGYTPDWIIAPLYLDQTIGSCVTDLKTLLDNIS